MLGLRYLMDNINFSQKDDKELVADYLNGQEEVLPYLINKYLKPVYRFVFSMVLDESVADDITQDVFIKVWKKIKSYNNKYSFKTWLFSIVRNTVIDYFRKKKDIAFSKFENEVGDNFFVDTLVDSLPLPDEDFSRIEDAGFLAKTIEKLPLIYREVLILRYTEDLSMDEISGVLKRPVETIKSQHRRGLLHLKEHLTRSITSK